MESKSDAHTSDLNHVEERMRSIVDHVVDGIISIDERGVVLTFNRAAERIFGYAADEVIGRNVNVLMPEPFHGEHDGYIANYLRTGVAKIIGIGREVVGRYKDGSTFPMDLAISVFTVGERRFFTGIVRDITARKAAEEELSRNAKALKEAFERAQKATRIKDEFLAIVSHELRTPLTAMHGWAQMIKDGRLDETQTRHGIDVIVRNIRAQTQLIEDLLDISRIVSGKLNLNVRPANIEQVIANAVESLHAAADAKGVRLEADLQHINIAVDSDRLQQVLWNLLSNALKFTEKKIGVVTVRLKQVASHVEIVVADNGKGIKREFLPHLFERFSQEDSSSTRGYGGLGLGLSIAKNLVEAHGGKLSADSGGEGQGASFTVALPIPALVNAPRKVPLGETLFGQEAMLDGIRVLIVDDEADARDLLVAVIGNRGAVTASAASAAEALASLPTFKPDLILSDIGMPGTDGYALIQAIRALDDDALKNVPAIALTAYASAEDKQRALDSGYLAHAPKPFDVNRLIAMIANLALTGPKRGSAKGP